MFKYKNGSNYVNENGDIETDDLVNTSPFDDQDVLELFGEKIKILNLIVNTVHGVVQVRLKNGARNAKNEDTYFQ